MADPVQRALEKIAELVDDLRARTQVVESRLADLDRKHESVTAAQRTWMPVMVARDDLVIASGAAETASVPVAIARTLQAGRALDVEVRDAGDQVELIDARGRVLAKLPRAAFLALPRVVASPETSRMLGLAVHVQGVRTVQTGRASVAPSSPARGARPVAGGPAGLDSVVGSVAASGVESGERPDSSGLAPGPAQGHSGPVARGGRA